MAVTRTTNGKVTPRDRYTPAAPKTATTTKTTSTSTTTTKKKKGTTAGRPKKSGSGSAATTTTTTGGAVKTGRVTKKKPTAATTASGVQKTHKPSLKDKVKGEALKVEGAVLSKSGKKAAGTRMKRGEMPKKKTSAKVKEAVANGV